jgi:hypothetical protein
MTPPVVMNRWGYFYAMSNEQRFFTPENGRLYHNQKSRF